VAIGCSIASLIAFFMEFMGNCSSLPDDLDD
jgi:hypothetical protein